MKIVLCYQNNIANCIVTLLKTETQGIIGFLIISTVVKSSAEMKSESACSSGAIEQQ